MRYLFPAIVISGTAFLCFWLTQSQDSPIIETVDVARDFLTTEEKTEQDLGAPAIRSTNQHDTAPSADQKLADHSNSMRDRSRSESAIENQPQRPSTPAQTSSTATDEYVTKLLNQLSDPATSDQAYELVNELLSGKTNASYGFCKVVAEQIIRELPGSSVAARAELFRIASRYQESKSIDDRLVHQLDTFARDYPESEMPIRAYQCVCDQLVFDRKSYDAVLLARHGVKAAQPFRDVKSLEAYLRMSEQTYALIRPNRYVSSSFVARTATMHKHSQFTSKKFSKFVGKPMSLPGAQTLDGQMFANQVSGDWTLVHFWATWNESSRAFAKSMSSVFDDWKNKQVRFVGVSLDDDPSEVEAFVKENQLEYPQIINPEKARFESPLAKANGVDELPVAFLVGPNGKVVEAGIHSERVDDALRVHVDHIKSQAKEKGPRNSAG